MKKGIFLFILILSLSLVAGCTKALNVLPQSQTKEDVEIRVSVLRDAEWYLLSQDILVLNLEVINNSLENIWIYPLQNSIIVDTYSRQFSPVREFFYQPNTSPKVSFELSFRTKEPPRFSFALTAGEEERDKRIEELIRTYEITKFKDGRIFSGARVSGIIAFYIPYCKFPARYIIPDVVFESSLKKSNFEFILEK
ncbi:MAG TPA: hypothetical protein PKW23_05900 [Dictyoglomaceae bacterium]|nr:hypothetical protein [Dictyoglomaceae bacterium]HOL38704.1 hypothetical protein [Dictyoglomaceae bacterium]HOP94592.1 hypothetical protein [Dictyoglomaceae bacterium]HPP15547.1 hypothetical protein [Dictyoglomaceae bacterium]HPU42862.1 hypothetical protein [Dictyoglomaceae bacterium]